MERADVAVVGGGPAGSSAARAAAEAGADVVLLEKGVPREDRAGLGPDSTDAAGMLDYWLDLMDLAPDAFPEEVILSELDGAEFIGPSASVTIRSTGLDASYEGFGFTFHRARFDDWLRERAEDAGADYRVGTSVRGVESDLEADEHTVSLADGEDIRAEYLVLADGPQRTVTTRVLDQFLADRSAADVLSPVETNHIAYQEHRRMPDELFEPGMLKFWWGVIPGHTAYPWVFPNDDCVARIGLTMPIGLERDDYDADEWALLDPDDESIPDGATYIERLLSHAYPEYDLADFPLVEDRGKSGGTETYPISSTRPIESPVGAGVAVAGGAMGTTSAFHEGGDHVAFRTGKLAGRLAAEGRLAAYNDAWQDAIGDEIVRNVALADVVAEYGPADWDRAFGTADRMLRTGGPQWRQALGAGLNGLRLFLQYRLAKRRLRDGAYVQLSADDYAI